MESDDSSINTTKRRLSTGKSVKHSEIGERSTQLHHDCDQRSFWASGHGRLGPNDERSNIDDGAQRPIESAGADQLFV